MMGLGEIPARSAACWGDAAWRTEKLRQIKAQHKLKHSEIGERVGRAETTVRIWLVGKPRPIPANTLRVLLLDLAGDA